MPETNTTINNQPIGDSRPLDALHHIAIAVTDIASAVDWYTGTFACEVSYQDESWAFLRFQNLQVALVIPEQHPPHIAFSKIDAERFGDLKTHRDGTRSCYLKDPSGNAVEILDAASLQITSRGPLPSGANVD